MNKQSFQSLTHTLPSKDFLKIDKTIPIDSSTIDKVKDKSIKEGNNTNSEFQTNTQNTETSNSNEKK